MGWCGGTRANEQGGLRTGQKGRSHAATTHGRSVKGFTQLRLPAGPLPNHAFPTHPGPPARRTNLGPNQPSNRVAGFLDLAVGVLAAVGERFGDAVAQVFVHESE